MAQHERFGLAVVEVLAVVAVTIGPELLRGGIETEEFVLGHDPQLSVLALAHGQQILRGESLFVRVVLKAERLFGEDAAQASRKGEYIDLATCRVEDVAHIGCNERLFERAVRVGRNEADRGGILKREIKGHHALGRSDVHPTIHLPQHTNVGVRLHRIV